MLTIPMRHWRASVHRTVAALAVLSFALSPAVFSPALAQTENQAPEMQTEAIQDWNLQCQPGPEGENVCQLFQEASLEGTERPILRALVGYRTPNSDTLTLVLVLPLGVSLSKGAFMQIDSNQPVAVPFERCEPGGCLIFLAMNDSLLQALKGGINARLIFHDTQHRRGAATISLRGFTAGIDRLSANKPG